MWVKICANTNLDDALMAAELGADAVGFVFAPSKRQVTVAKVAEITPRLPKRVEAVGVFAGQDAVEIARAAVNAGLTAVQLHGGFNQKLADDLAGLLPPEISMIQTAHWRVDAEAGPAVLEDLAMAVHAGGRYRVLIDAAVGSASGGLGVAFDWDQASLAFRAQPTLRLIVAGGLRPETVGDAIRALRPWGVDVASGVEAAPGRKSYDRVRDFIENARNSS